MVGLLVLKVGRAMVHVIESHPSLMIISIQISKRNSSCRRIVTVSC